MNNEKCFSLDQIIEDAEGYEFSDFRILNFQFVTVRVRHDFLGIREA